MKVAVATADGNVSAHFGHAPGFTVADIADGGVSDLVYFDNDDGNCRAIPQKLAQMGVSVAIVGGIGQGAVNNLQHNGIDVIGSVSGTITDVLDAYVRGALTGGDLGCSHHDDDGCGDHHHH